MMTKHQRESLTWIDLESPSQEELRSVMREYRVDGRIEEEIISPTPYPIVVPFPEYIYLILHFPVADIRGGAKSQEIDFIVGKNFIITVRYEVIESIHNLHKVFEAEELLGITNTALARTDVLLERLLRRLYGAIREEVGQVATALERIERDVFNGKERESVRGISLLGRTLLRFDTTLARHEEALSSFLTELCKPTFFGKSFAEHATHIEAERASAATLVRSYREAANELRSTNDSLLTSSQNEVMKVLTIMAFVTFPLTLISSIFGMNTDFLPIVGAPGDFWIILGMMVALAVSFFAFFRWKRWL